MWSEQQNVVQIEREANAQASTPGIGQALGGGLATKRRPEDLTPREQEILQLVWAGLTNRTIAERLHISIKTAALMIYHFLGSRAKTLRDRGQQP